jgi:hypothetical protein
MSDRTEPEIILEPIFKLPIEQIVACIDKLLETRLDITVANYTQRDHPIDSYTWDIELPGESGYISVRKSILDKTTYGISSGIKRTDQGKAVELPKIHKSCLQACLDLATLAEQSSKTKSRQSY